MGNNDFSDFLLGYSPEFMSIRENIQKVAEIYSGIIITGEPGSGKEHIARHIHKSWNGGSVNFHSLEANIQTLALIKKMLLNNTLVPGTFFTPIPNTDPGFHFVLSITEALNLSGADFKKDAFKIIFSIEPRVFSRFQRDWPEYYHVMPEIPPLRKRSEDLPLFIDFFNRFFNRKYNKNIQITEPAMNKLMNYPWPGNLDELIITIEKAVKTSKHELIYKIEM